MAVLVLQAEVTDGTYNFHPRLYHPGVFVLVSAFPIARIFRITSSRSDSATFTFDGETEEPPTSRRLSLRLITSSKAYPQRSAGSS